MRYRGALTALVTPFREGGIDLPALSELVRWQLDEGIDGLVACGCTGEAATLSADEHIEVVSAVMEAAAGMVPVIAGAGKNDTRATIDLSRRVAALGVDGILLITPYYNKPTPDGQFAHFMKVADSVDCDVILYNVPGRTGVNMTPETIARLSEHPGIVAVKDAAGAAERVSAIRELCGIDILSGDDALAMAEVALGAVGVISVISNTAPAMMSSLMSLTASGDLPAAREIQDELYPLMRALFLETSPGPVKKALSMMGRIRDELRLPLVPMSERHMPELRKAMEGAGLM
jgi:4-hydroxy-tetrahydrodipicolinate synthase